MTKENQLSIVESGNNFIALVEKVATNPDVDVDKLEKLLAMQITVMDKQAEIAYNQALAKVQEELPVIEHDAEIKFKGKVQSTYSKYETVDAVIRPILIKNGFSLSFDTTDLNDKTFVIGYLAHRQGHKEKRMVELPLDTSGSKNTIQAMGSTISYGKRYLVGMLLNLVTKGEDNDGILPDDHTEQELIESAHVEVNNLMRKLPEKNRVPHLKALSVAKDEGQLSLDFLTDLKDKIEIEIKNKNKSNA